jgi:CBS domain containing-hemolysin-like protein
MNETTLFVAAILGFVGISFFALCEGALFSLKSSQLTAETTSVAELIRSPDQLQRGTSFGRIVSFVWMAATGWLTADLLMGGRFGALVGLGSVLIVAVIALVFADRVARAIGAERPEAWARRTAPVLAMWTRAVEPATAILGHLDDMWQRAESGDLEDDMPDTDAPSLDAPSLFFFGETTVREVMTPRPDVIAIDAHCSWRDAAELVQQSGHSRIPVYRGDLDTMVGVLYAKELVVFVHSLAPAPNTIEELLWEPTFVPEAKRIDDLLREFQRDRIHLAIVVDEYGGMAGIVTLEDIIEELVGEIRDQHDREEPRVELTAGGGYRLDGGFDLDDFNELTGSDLRADEVDTVGGLVASEMGRIAEGGEEVRLADWLFRVEAVDGKRITRVVAEPVEDDESATKGDAA